METIQVVHVQQHGALKPYSAAACQLAAGGVYQHYSGKRYKVLAVGRHTETEEELVVYQSLADGEVWVRPVAMFVELVALDGVQQPRFKLLAQM